MWRALDSMERDVDKYLESPRLLMNPACPTESRQLSSCTETPTPLLERHLEWNHVANDETMTTSLAVFLPAGPSRVPEVKMVGNSEFFCQWRENLTASCCNCERARHAVICNYLLLFVS